MEEGEGKVVQGTTPPPFSPNQQLPRVLELKISMHCRACERSVVNSLRSIKGVEGISTERDTQKVIVKGSVDPKKILKKVRRRTRKRVEILPETNEARDGGGDDSRGDDKGDELVEDVPVRFDMFSDENPNATCVVM